MFSIEIKNMASKQSFIPKWFIILTALFSLMEIAVAISLAFSPSSFLEDVDLNAKGVDYIIKMWAVRQFALGVILAYAAYKRSSQMLSISWIFILVMFLGDTLIGIQQKTNSLVIAGLIMSIIAAGMLYFITKIESLRKEAI